jgi:PAS domain S-box-containing protein
VVSSRDVTDRKRAERRQRRTETRLEELAENAADVLWMFTGDWSELLFINDAYGEIWGLSIDRLREDPEHFLEGVHPEDRPQVLEEMDQISAGEPRDLEYRVNPAEGHLRWVWVKAKPVVEDGEVVMIVGFSRDITNCRRRERQLGVLDNLLRHNIRNDQNVITGNAEVAKSHGGATVAECMDAVLDTAADLLGTTGKDREIISVLVGIDDRERYDVVPTVESVLEDFRDRHPDASVRLDAPPTRRSSRSRNSAAPPRNCSRTPPNTTTGHRRSTSESTAGTATSRSRSATTHPRSPHTSAGPSSATRRRPNSITAPGSASGPSTGSSTSRTARSSSAPARTAVT